MLELKKIRKSFDGKTILNGIDLQIQDEEIIFILGPSGSGKTTLLNLILGITEIDSGKLIFNGKDLTDARWKSVDSTSSFRIMRCFRT